MVYEIFLELFAALRGENVSVHFVRALVEASSILGKGVGIYEETSDSSFNFMHYFVVNYH